MYNLRKTQLQCAKHLGRAILICYKRTLLFPVSNFFKIFKMHDCTIQENFKPQWRAIMICNKHDKITLLYPVS